MLTDMNTMKQNGTIKVKSIDYWEEDPNDFIVSPSSFEPAYWGTFMSERV